MKQEMKAIMLRVTAEQDKLLRTFKEKTGSPITRTIRLAIGEFFQRINSRRIEQ
jgi:hypothetical protein